MSSLRNSLHRRNHKERSQLAHRQRFGILEKHKDYVLRARDYHSKQDRLNLLRQRAAARNKDEFYFGMNRQRTEGGVHVQDRGNQSLPVDIVKVLKTQDENYLRTMRTLGLKKIDKLKSQLSALADLLKPLNGEEDNAEQGLDEEELQVLREAKIIAAPEMRRRKSTQQGKHVIFAESKAEARSYLANSRRKHQGDHDNNKLDVVEEKEADLGWKVPEEDRKGKKRQSQSAEDAFAQLSLDKGRTEAGRRKLAAKHRTRLLKQLSARLVRDKHMRYAERELEMQRLLMSKGGAKKLRGVEKVEGNDDEDEDEDEPSGRQKKVDEKTWKPKVYKWRVERKK
ncbi:u3 small nucleolar RNA-associated protein 11 [Wolfiporia cocos MD-104 SS10]|uniref:U3 small nucleolar RNA-associated protein 11 n=1 Tax=Wolfiporia cocos (strain MD-104) TaxID=742152 RepID=A0A2H3JDI1_WOLCO|nr:u3 small nucleolar RNA-associated protein 11 [Wolfiporia cocos MD-104 SS10]